MKKRFTLILTAVLALTLAACGKGQVNNTSAKPVIYFYPEEETRVTVTLDYDGQPTTTYPAYENGWTVVAHPDGTLTDPVTGREYYCLFWEGALLRQIT